MRPLIPTVQVHTETLLTNTLSSHFLLSKAHQIYLAKTNPAVNDFLVDNIKDIVKYIDKLKYIDEFKLMETYSDEERILYGRLFRELRNLIAHG